MVNVKKVAIFVGGMLFGSAGFKILASKDAKKVYTQTTAAVLRMKDCTMETVSRVQEEAGDILADAKAINEARAAAAEQEVIADDAAESACRIIASFGPPAGGPFMWWGTAAERMMPLSLCQNWQLGKLNKEIQL